MAIFSREFTFQSLIVLSYDPVARIYPLGLKAIELIQSEWFENVAISSNVLTFQSLNFLSSAPVARIVPS